MYFIMEEKHFLSLASRLFHQNILYFYVLEVRLKQDERTFGTIKDSTIGKKVFSFYQKFQTEQMF